jgi:hypothetical protein
MLSCGRYVDLQAGASPACKIFKLIARRARPLLIYMPELQSISASGTHSVPAISGSTALDWASYGQGLAAHGIAAPIVSANDRAARPWARIGLLDQGAPE